METIKTFNGNWLASNNSITTCCCGGEFVPTGYYYEGLTCEGKNRLRFDGSCDEWDQCRITNRIFVNQNSKCDIGEVKVCECHLLQTPDFSLIKTGSVTNTIEILNQTGFTLTVDWGDTSVLFSLSNGASLLYDFTHQRFSDLITAANLWNNLISIYINGDNNMTPFFIKSVVKIIPNETSSLFPSRNSGFYFIYNSRIDVTGALASTIPADFNSNIQESLRRLIAPDMESKYNEGNVGVSNLRYFELKFASGLCGERQSLITGYNCVIDQSNGSHSFTFLYPEYRQQDHYLTQNGAEHKYFISEGSGLCPYEDITDPSFTQLYTKHTGPLAPKSDEEMSCCPQGGATYGKNQYVGFPTEGYSFIPAYTFDHWWNLEKTIIRNDCRVLPPEFFTVGKKGRHDFVYSYDKPPHLTCDCDFPSGCSSSNDNLPGSCTPELFVAQLHKNVPWGPFGSYYANVEGDTHPAWLFPYSDPDFNPLGDQSYLSTIELCARDGWDYRPTGMIGTIGTWRHTKRIDLAVDIKRPMPFHVGPDAFDELDYRCQVATGSIASGLVVTGNNGCDPIYISFYTSGKTVGNFIDEMNALRLTIPVGDGSGCPVFAFCAGSESARGIASNKIINTSSELFEQQYSCGNSSSFIGGTGPENDLYKDKISGQSFASVPLSYPDMNKNSIFNLFRSADEEYDPPAYNMGLPTGVTGERGAVPDTFSVHYECGLPVSPGAIKLPPICRWFNRHLPLEAGTKILPEVDFLYNPTMWWTPILGNVEPVISISRSGTDLSVNNLTLQVSSGKIIIRSYSGATINNSGVIQLTGYTTYSATQCVTDLNNIRFNYTTGVGNYQPISAVYNTDLIQTPLFIHNTITDASAYTYGPPGGGFVNTLYNYGYQEPPEEKSETSIISNSSNIDAWMRRRCGKITSYNGTVIKVNNFCVPPDALAIAGDVNCEGEQAISNGWLYTYGCGSPKCKTEYFVKAVRCSCNQVYRCNEPEGRFVGHPYNFEGGEANDQTYGEFQVSQPTFYMCEYNFHPDCDVPMMVKVPFQVNDESRNVLWHNGEYGTYFNSESVDPRVIPQLAILSCEFCNNDLGLCTRESIAYSNAQGWCQYIDPLGIKVKYEEIPYSWPSKAVVAFRSSKPFCSINHWNFKPEYIFQGSVTIGDVSYGCKPDASADCLTFSATEGADCNECPSHEACPDCLNYDRVENCKPVYDTGVNNQDSLTVLLRPIYQGDSIPVCNPSGVSVCNDYDITCATSCCECLFACQENSSCFQLVRHPFTQNRKYDYEYRSEGGPWECAPETLYFSICGHQVYGCCSSNCTVRPCIEGTCSFGNNLHLSSVRTSCNCTIEGCYTQNEPVCIVDCSEAPTSVCYSAYVPRPTPNISPPNCNYSCLNIPAFLTGSEACCGDPCIIGVIRLQTGCAFLGDIYEGSCFTQEAGDCGSYEGTLSVIKRIKYFGTSPVDGSPLGISSACEWEGEQIDTTFESLSIENKQWTNCPFENETPDGLPYNEVKNLRYTIEAWIPGYANIAISSGLTPASDSRFLGGLC